MNLNYNSALVWLLSASFCLVLTLHIIENKKLKIYLQQKCKGEPAKQILRFSWSRTVQLLAVMSFSFVLMIIYNQQVSDYREETINLQKAIITMGPNMQADKIAKITPDYYPPVANGNVDKRVTAPAVQPNQILNQQNTIQDIFGAEKNFPDSKNIIDDIKARYEELIVTYMIMEKCERTKASDYQLIMTALQKEIAAAQAPIRLQDDILTAAKGSYEELYARNDCQQSDIDVAATQYNAYIDRLAENSAVH